MTRPTKRITGWIIALAALVCLPLACGPSGDDISDLRGVWVNVKGLKGRPIVVRFYGYRGRVTIGTFFIYDFKIVRAVKKGTRYTLFVEGKDGRRGTHDLVRLGPDLVETRAQGIHFIFRRLSAAEAARHRHRKF